MRKIFLQLIRFHQRASSFFYLTLKLLWPVDCRFWPSCSGYAYLVVERYGWAKGSWLSARRIVKCHPFSEGGVDLP